MHLILALSSYFSLAYGVLGHCNQYYLLGIIYLSGLHMACLPQNRAKLEGVIFVSAHKSLLVNL